MSLGDDVRQFVPAWREASESLMVDTATIWRQGPSVFDPATGLLTDSRTAIHSGPCRIRPATAEEATHQFGEQQVTTSRHIACFPHDVTGVRVGDVIEVTASDDIDLIGTSLRITATPVLTFVLYRGFPVEVVE